METLFNSDTKKNILDRLSDLKQDSKANWGKMNVGQMLHHCQFPLKIAVENSGTDLKPNYLARIFFKKSLYNDRLWPKNLPTVPSLKVKTTKNFEEEKIALIQLIDSFHQMKDKSEFKPHPIFGKFTTKQWGQMQYKHLDHHFRQFGV